MENASKALLIAASVLIVILLIAFSISIFDSTSGTKDNVEETMKATEIATFNNRFSAYFATSGKSAAQAKALANIVTSNNSTNPTKKVKIVIVNGPGGSDVALSATDDALTIMNTVAQLSGSGSILATGRSEQGLITEITLTY